MKKLTAVLIFAALCIGVAACQPPSPKGPPVILAEGFDFDAPHQAMPGQFQALRLRVQAPAGIESLSVVSTLHEVELARGSDRDQLGWFGLTRAAAKETDVTLDLAPYLNKWVSTPGEMLIGIEVQDRAGQKTERSLIVGVQEAGG